MIESILRNELYRSDKVISDNGIRSRLSRARSSEKILGYSLDYAVSTDERMYESLCALRDFDKSGNYQNALRWYYRAKHERSFPRLSDYALIRKCSMRPSVNNG